MIWLGIAIGFIVGFAIAAELGRTAHNLKMTEIRHIADSLDETASDGLIKHFDKTHFAAITLGDRKFVYCPVGNICSWNDGDFDHRYCAWCKKYFTDIGGQQ